MPKSTQDITFSQIRYFVRAAELGSMTEAAGELFVAQSAVSTAVAQLEETLGSQLLIRRRSRGVVLTEQGQNFYAGALEVMLSIDEAVNSVHPEALTGQLTAGIFTTLAPFWLPELHDALSEAHPELTVRLREVTADQVEPMLQRREIEVALTYSFDYGRDVTFDPICKAPIYAAVSPTSPLADREAVTLEELAEEPLVLLDLGKSSNYFLSLFRAADLQPRIHQRFESFEVVRSMVARGHGCTILNQRPTHDLTNDGGRIVRVPLDGVRSALQIGVARRTEETLSRKGEAFIAECRRVFATESNHD